MRLPDTILHSAAFLGVEINGAAKMAGTAFFLSMESELRPDVAFGYLVTAKHCVEDAKQYGPLLLRLNYKEGNESRTDELQNHWIYHDDDENDVAVLPFAAPPSEYQFVVAQRESLATDDVINREAIGIGDELAVVGLFTKRTGKTVNRPIVRSGIISSMPDEPLVGRESGREYDAYLAEVRSIGGLSGSPVWLVIRPGRVSGEKFEFHRQHFYLLGLIRGHWPKYERELGDAALDEERDMLNTGIAMVTPIQKALDIIDSDELRKARRKHDREELARSDEANGREGDAGVSEEAIESDA